jgi:phage gp29-like protein
MALDEASRDVVRSAPGPGNLLRVNLQRRGAERYASGRRGASYRGLAGNGAGAGAPTGILSEQLFGDRVPISENYRVHYGRALDLAKIDFAMREAAWGFMRPLTDLSRETAAIDGHLSSLLQKRLNRLAALDWEVSPASEETNGAPVDGDRAEELASIVRGQLKGLPRFRDALTQLAWGVWDGRSASEKLWRRERLWTIDDLCWIHPRRLSFDQHRDLRVVDASRSGGGFLDVGYPIEEVPFKFITYKPQLFADYQEREGLAWRALYWSFFCRFGARERMSLMELYSRPWRTVRTDPAYQGPPDDRALETAYQAVQRLGFNNAAKMPPGVVFDLLQPAVAANGPLFADSIDHAMKILSKLVLGNTGTTDAVSTGLGSSIGDAHLSEEDLIIWADANRLAEVIQAQLVREIVELNFGREALAHCPQFKFRTEPPLDVEQEQKRFDAALELGMTVPLEQAREKLGIRELKDGEPYLQRVQRPAEFGQTQPPPANETIYAIGEAPPVGEVTDAPLVAVNDNGPGDGAIDSSPRLPPGPPSPGGPPGDAPPPALPPGSDALGDGTSATLSTEDEPDHVAELAAKMTELGIQRCEHSRSNRCPICGIERVRDVSVDAATGEPVWGVAWKPIPKSASVAA